MLDLKKWTKMIFGKSNLYVNQPVGNFMSKTEIKGYYNDLSEKVIREKVDFGNLPICEKTKKTTTIPIQIFQFGLGSYECFLKTQDGNYLKSFWTCVRFALDSMNSFGGWKAFPERENPYSAMAQGEGISLLSRAFALTNEDKYKDACIKAYQFMIDNTMKNINGLLYLYEVMDYPLVLNGMIFSIFGIYDMYLLFKDEKYKLMFDQCCLSLEKLLPLFDLKKWSYYSIDKKYASTFYMKLHISQLDALYYLTHNQVFNFYSIKWNKSYNKRTNRFIFTIKKLYQKVKE